MFGEPSGYAEANREAGAHETFGIWGGHDFSKGATGR